MLVDAIEARATTAIDVKRTHPVSVYEIEYCGWYGLTPPHITVTYMVCYNGTEDLPSHEAWEVRDTISHFMTTSSVINSEFAVFYLGGLLSGQVLETNAAVFSSVPPMQSSYGCNTVFVGLSLSSSGSCLSPLTGVFTLVMLLLVGWWHCHL